MAITILAPAPTVPFRRTVYPDDNDEDSDDGGVDLEGDSQMRPSKRAKNDIVTPGEIVTDDPQWMRHVNHGSLESNKV
jgi:exosome complex component RRP4